MDIVIAGGHGQIARRLATLLVARGDRVRSLIRNPDHAADLRADGSAPVVCDLEQAEVEDVAGAIAGADAVVFAAGAGPGSGAQRKLTVRRRRRLQRLPAGEGAGRRGAGRQRPRVDHRPPGLAHRRARHGARAADDRSRPRRRDPRRRRGDAGRGPARAALGGTHLLRRRRRRPRSRGARRARRRLTCARPVPIADDGSEGAEWRR
jgi:hypothetical protein